ncbi:hypothetical protein F2Q68_00005292 [Brassica cretica]|uniref:Uncharacterized protein n=1 Tax=Brassica cretica TaxID=69181 RepID=A0A8S9JN01_BRACR|nr:hypothetical protein F2Q68_00005292 [Brassica cretica]
MRERVEKESKRFRAVTRVVESFRGPKFCREVPKYYPEARGGSVRLLISPIQSNQDIDVGFWLSTLRSTSCSLA